MATRRYLGTSQRTRAWVGTFTPATVEAGDAFAIRLEDRDGKSYSISFTCDAGADEAARVKNVVEGLKAAALVADAAAIAPWNAVTATENDAVLTLTADAVSLRYWPTTSTTDGGGNNTQTLTYAEATAPWGPNIYDDADNWQGQTVPIDADTVIIAADCPADIDGKDASDIELTRFVIEYGYAGAIGSRSHPLYLDFTGVSGAVAEIAGTGEQHLKLDAADLCYIRQAAPAPAKGEYGLNLTGSGGDALYIQPDSASASIGIGPRADDTAEWATISVDDGAVFIGEAVVKNGGTEIDSLTCTGGTVVCEGNTGILNLKSGSPNVTYRGAAVDTVKAYAGSLKWDTNAGITTGLYAGGCMIDFDAGFGAATIALAVLYAGYDITDTKRRLTWTLGWDYIGCDRSDGSLNFGPDYTETPSALN